MIFGFHVTSSSFSKVHPPLLNGGGCISPPFFLRPWVRMYELSRLSCSRVNRVLSIFNEVLIYNVLVEGGNSRKGKNTNGFQHIVISIFALLIIDILCVVFLNCVCALSVLLSISIRFCGWILVYIIMTTKKRTEIQHSEHLSWNDTGITSYFKIERERHTPTVPHLQHKMRLRFTRTLLRT